MSHKKEYRTFEFKVNDAVEKDGIGIIEGYASTFGNVDLGLDVVEKGAFAKTIADNKGKFIILLDHNDLKPIGWNTEAVEDNYGLKVKGEIMLITEEAKNRYALAKRAQELGTKMGLSIGYSVIKSEPDFDRPEIRRLKELRLWEYSPVTFPMNTQASITGVKSSDVMQLFDRLQKKGYDLTKLESALEKLFPAAHIETDPELLQSVEKLVRMMTDPAA